jgi:type I restriction enzyme, R subunit
MPEIEHIHERLVLDWRRKAETVAEVRVVIRDTLDELPDDPYPRTVYDAKVQAVFDHVSAAYGNDGASAYDLEPAVTQTDRLPSEVSVESITAAAVERIRTDAHFAALVALQLRDEGATFALTIDQLLANDEDAAVEFKSTGRWDIRNEERSPVIEDAIVKTVAAFLNTDGGTLLIGIGPDGTVVGLDHDYAHVKPSNGDGFVNWLTTHLINALGAPAVMRTRARVVNYQDEELCRLDVGRSTRPVTAKTSKDPHVFFVRMNNSSRQVGESERDEYIAQHWAT